MASQKHTHRAAAIGVSGGFALALPLAAYAATLPFDGAHDVVRVVGLPFALGAFAGAGVHALATSYYEAKDERLQGEQGTDANEPAEAVESDPLGVTGFFRRREDDSVPVISRAVDALSEAEAWAEIDQLLEEDSPISCDAATSKDIYQIALEELARAAGASAAAAQAASEGADAGEQAAATMLAAAGGEAGEACAASPARAAADAQATMQLDAGELAAAQKTAQLAFDALELDEPSGAFDLDELNGARTAVQDAAADDSAVEDAAVDAVDARADAEEAAEAPAIDAAAPETEGEQPEAAVDVDASTVEAQAVLVTEAEVPAEEHQLAAAVDADASAGEDQLVAQASADAVEETSVEVPASESPCDGDAARDAVQEVVMVDYSGHEAMWAAAIAILEEDARAANTAPYRPKHAKRVRAGAPAPVDSFDRKAGREYLRVIEGGTGSMPALKSKA